MFDLLKVVLETLLSGLDLRFLTDKKREKIRRSVGADLFRLYLSINDIVVTGRGIVALLQRSVDRFDQHLKQGDTGYVCNEVYLPGLMWVQLGNINRLKSTIHALAREIQLLDPKVYLELAPLLHAKQDAIGVMSQVLASGNLPLFPPPETYLPRVREAFRAARDAMTRHPDGSDREEEMVIWHAALVAQEAVERELEDFVEHALCRPAHLTAHQYERLREYLARYEPEARLNEISTLGENLRRSILGTFTLDDVLFEIGDRRSPLPLGDYAYLEHHRRDGAT